MDRLVAEKQFTAPASRERSWDLLGTLIFDSIPGLEKMEIADENNFRADLKAKAFGIPLTMRLKGEMLDTSPPERLVVRLDARSKWNVIAVVQRITFSLTPVGEEGVNMSCLAVAENPAPLVRLVLLGQVRRQARQIFDSIEGRLKELA